MAAYRCDRVEDMARLAMDLVVTDHVQRACALTYAMHLGMVQGPFVLRIALRACVHGLGHARGVARMASTLSRHPMVLNPVWEDLLRALAHAHSDADGVHCARVDQHGLDSLLEFMGRLGWQARSQPANLPNPMPPG